MTAVAVAALTVSLAACGERSDDRAAAGAGSGYPVTVDNCGQALTIKSRPKNVLMLSTVTAPSIEEAGGLGQLGSYTGNPESTYLSDAVRSRLKQIPQVVSQVTSSDLNREKVVDIGPDLVIGYGNQAISPDSLAEVGIPMYVPPAWCANPPAKVSFDDAYKQVEVFGKIFGHPDTAAGSVEDMRKRVAAVKPNTLGLTKAAFVYPRADGGALSSYGTGSIADAQIKQLGLTNVYGDKPGRGFEVSAESLVDADPQVVIVVYSETSDAATARKQFEAVPGVASIDAVKAGRIIAVPVAALDPAGPGSVSGLEFLSEQLAKVPAAAGN
ncbi:MAG: ABC transporter substrate-binding protein [Gordonia sp. (in: high G+C Gram-positive bacteria)]